LGGVFVSERVYLMYCSMLCADIKYDGSAIVHRVFKWLM